MLRFKSIEALRIDARSLAATLLVAMLFLLPTSCTSSSGASGCLIFSDGTLIEFDPDVLDGFDDFASTGAALGVGVDTDGDDVGLIIAARFASSTTERTYSPSCNPGESIEGYDFFELNSITTDIAADHFFLRRGLTNTAGIESMGNSMVALLFINDAMEGLKIYLAVAGDITLFRDLGVSSSARVVGDLTFVEITSASDTAEVEIDPEMVRIDDIDMTWDTVVQPTD